MNKTTHITIGIIACVFYILGISYITPIESNYLAFGFLFAFLGSILPDIIEPPTSAWHRGTFHSWDILKKVSLIFLIFTLIGLLLHFFLVVSCFCLGYGLHLIADSLTPAGLP